MKLLENSRFEQINSALNMQLETSRIEGRYDISSNITSVACYVMYEKSLLNWICVIIINHSYCRFEKKETILACQMFKLLVTVKKSWS